MDRQRLGNALTAVALYCIVVELVIKHLWEVKHARTAKCTHNVLGLFDELDSATRDEIERIYGRCCSVYADAVRDGVQQLGAAAVQVEIANIREALEWNQSAMRDFKYDMTPDGKSVPSGVLWNSKTLWVLPSGVPNFAVSLTRWALSL